MLSPQEDSSLAMLSPQEEDDLLCEIIRCFRNKAIAKAMASKNSVTGEQGCKMLMSLSRRHGISYKEKRNEKNKKAVEKLRQRKRRQYAGSCHEEPEKELSPKANRKESISNSEAVDDTGNELVLYGEREISGAERSGNDEVVNDHGKGILFPVIFQKKRSARRIENDDNQEYEPGMDVTTETEEVSDLEDEKPRQKKARGNKTRSLSEPSPPQNMSEVMQQTVTGLGGEGTPVHWLFEKDLTKSDTLRSQGRIFLSQTVKDFLTPAERKQYWVLKGDMSSNRNEEKKMNCTVALVEPDGKASEIDFKIWASLRKIKAKPVVGEGQPVLTANWNDLVQKYKMAKGTKLQFWCFRKKDTSELCFAMNNKA